MILLINICKEKLHFLEFVKPLEDILKNQKIGYVTKGYKEVQQKDLDKADKAIICGTSLMDNEFLKPENFRFFSWIKSFDKHLLGICGGMQILGMMFKGRIRKETEIGFFKENFDNDFLGLIGQQEVYHLHNYFIDFFNTDFDEMAISEKNIVQAVKHKSKPIYGVLFHPEVRQKEMIKVFCLI